MDDILLLPPNLADLGVRRATPANIPDLITVWKTPYPVISGYLALCRDLGWAPFAGGTYDHQGVAEGPGYVTSGYRDVPTRKDSPHLFAIALDVAVGNTECQIEAARAALRHFTRVGLYPGKGFIHLDLAPMAWMKAYSGKRFWVCKAGIYTSFDDFDRMIAFAQ